jgi:hypothetical protein
MAPILAPLGTTVGTSLVAFESVPVARKRPGSVWSRVVQGGAGSIPIAADWSSSSTWA